MNETHKWRAPVDVRWKRKQIKEITGGSNGDDEHSAAAVDFRMNNLWTRHTVRTIEGDNTLVYRVQRPAGTARNIVADRTTLLLALVPKQRPRSPRLIST